MAHDLVIRGGSVVDGTGRDAFAAAFAVGAARITAIGVIDAPGNRARKGEMILRDDEQTGARGGVVVRR